MKTQLLLICLIFLNACKHEFTLAPVISSAPFVFSELKIAGVSDDQITIEDQLITVTLPANYPYGKIIKPTVKLKNGYELETDFGGNVLFEGQSLIISVKSPVYGAYSFPVCVIPTAPLTLSPSMGNLNISIGPDNFINIPAEHTGTQTTSNASGKVITVPTVSLKNKVSGELFEDCQAGLFADANGNSFFRIGFPLHIQAGDYEAMITWGSRKSTLRDLISVRYGKLTLPYAGWGVTRENPVVNISGYNLYPENEYTMEIKNDFFPARKIKLDRKDYLNLTATLPADLPTGNYKATLFVDGEPVKAPESSIFAPANLVYNAFPDQPVLGYISQESIAEHSECTIYPSTVSISRGDGIVSYVSFKTEDNNVVIPVWLKLVNRETRAEHILETESPSFTANCYANAFNRFRIPAEVSNGQYEISAIIGSEITAAEKTSERLGQLITIK